MKFTRLGNSGLMVSRLCLGCMSYGDTTKGWHGAWLRALHGLNYALATAWKTMFGYQFIVLARPRAESRREA